MFWPPCQWSWFAAMPAGYTWGCNNATSMILSQLTHAWALELAQCVCSAYLFLPLKTGPFLSHIHSRSSIWLWLIGNTSVMEHIGLGLQKSKHISTVCAAKVQILRNNENPTLQAQAGLIKITITHPNKCIMTNLVSKCFSHLASFDMKQGEQTYMYMALQWTISPNCNAVGDCTDFTISDIQLHKEKAFDTVLLANFKQNFLGKETVGFAKRRWYCLSA